MAKFDEVMNYSDESIITNRIKILIKNMFTNKENGWAKSAEINKGGPKKKSEIQQEVENKYKAEQARHGGGNRDRGYGGKDGYNDRDRDGGRNRRNDGYNDGGNRRYQEGQNRYQKKETQGA